MSELKLITPRRNFLVRALAFTAAGATLPVGIVAADDPLARIEHHHAELKKAWAEYYGPGNVACCADIRPVGATYTSHGKQWAALSTIGLWGSESPAAQWGLENHTRMSEQPAS
jgi:hypothetical protein